MAGVSTGVVGVYGILAWTTATLVGVGSTGLANGGVLVYARLGVLVGVGGGALVVDGTYTAVGAVGLYGVSLDVVDMGVDRVVMSSVGVDGSVSTARDNVACNSGCARTPGGGFGPPRGLPPAG